MSSDAHSLAAIASKTNHEMRYFELVTIVNGPVKKKCFLCLGKHEIFFMSLDLNAFIFAQEGGSLYYAHLQKVVVDSISKRHCLLLLSDNRPACWGSERLFVSSERRDVLLRHLQVSWQTDTMWRLGRVTVFPLSKKNLEISKTREASVAPFLDFEWRVYKDYKFMVPSAFLDQDPPVERTEKSEFANEKTGATLVLHVHDLLTTNQLVSLNRDHIRWLALEYKQSLLQDEGKFYVLRNDPYTKRMNLAGDIASWHAWEMILRTETVTLVCMLLRRSYVPPVCNGAQDIAVIMRCPSTEESRQKDPREVDKRIREARLIADTLCSDNPSFPVYHDIVQAKLDALLFDDDAVQWISSYLKLKPKWRTEAKVFVRKLIQMYVDDATGGVDGDVLTSRAEDVVVSADHDEEWAELEGEWQAWTVERLIEHMRDSGEGLRASSDEAENLWSMRVSRYLAWAMNGGLLGSRFTIDHVLEGLNQLSDENQKIANRALNFMLHCRPRDMKIKFNAEESLQLKHTLQEFTYNNTPLSDAEGSSDAVTFNENVMMALLRTDFIKKLFAKPIEYYRCLAKFLGAEVGTNLKAYVCRVLMEDSKGKGPVATEQEVECKLTVLDPLVKMLDGGIFLATYASAALVNISYHLDAVKSKLMSMGVAKLLAREIKAKDDDLLCYNLMLMVNLTKETHHRTMMANAGILPLAYDLLTSNYHWCGWRSRGQAQTEAIGTAASSIRKEKLLVQLCIIIGQMCNEETFRSQFQKDYEYTLPCILYIYEHAEPGSTLACKGLFAMKQVSANSMHQKATVTQQAVKKIAADLLGSSFEKSQDFFAQSVLLLHVLANDPHNVRRMLDAGLTPSNLDELGRTSKIVRMSDYLRQRLDALKETIKSNSPPDISSV